jgi:zinc protease
MLNRSIAPPFKTIDKIDVMRTAHSKLNNGIDVYSLSAGSQEIIKIEFVFRAGMYHQPATLVASTTNTMLESGTRSYSANELSDGIDFYGSFLELHVEQDFATVTVFSLNKYIEETLKYVEELIKYPVFPEHEFKIHIANKRQKHSINSQKVNVLARRKFTELLFGENHPYGRDVRESDFDRISIKELKTFFNSYYTAANCTIFVSGNIPADTKNILNRFFGEHNWGGTTASKDPVLPAFQTSSKSRFLIPKDNAIQSAIRVGRVLFNKTHPDYFKFQVLNIILGGYFGSRLMANIREDKGYTYGIGSGLNNLVHGGYFFISTEVGADVTKPTLEEIYKELKRLREDLIDNTELETVRNYILGNFLRSVDGPFALSDKFKSIWEFGLDYSFFDNYFTAVKKVTATELRDLANKYLQEKDLVECVAGKM